jgi:colanic acid biosynthesis protein WcaH
MWLDDHEFLKVVRATPLVSIDLLIENGQKQVLLGKRLNQPAKGFWFVPGGRIRKNELVGEALTRLVREELGGVMKQSTLVGVFDHIYPDNFAGEPGINTHYVVIAFRGQLVQDATIKPDPQHSDLKWWPPKDLLASPHVHENTKRYFQAPPAR